jgi:hypothetical protein
MISFSPSRTMRDIVPSRYHRLAPTQNENTTLGLWRFAQILGRK